MATISTNNGIPIRRATFYKDIERTKDLISRDSPLKSILGAKVSNDFRISPNKIPLDPLVRKVLDQISKDFRSISRQNLPAQNDILSKGVEQLLKTFKTEAESDGLKAKLQADKHTGVLILAAKKLNASKLNPIDREILSREGNLMYGFYRAVIGLGVTDQDGVVSGTMASLGKIRVALNRALVPEIIAAKNLSASKEEISDIQAQVENASIPYDKKGLAKAVIAIYNKVKTSGGIIDEINEFLESGLVQIPAGLSRADIIDNMIDFLVGIGYVKEKEQEDDTELVPKDNLQAVKGIGPVREKKLNDNDIRTYGQLANSTLDKLNTILTDVSDEELNNYIEQAKLANKGEFEDFLNYDSDDEDKSTAPDGTVTN